MLCAHCEHELDGAGAAFEGDVCPHCGHLAYPSRFGYLDELAPIGRGGMAVVYGARHPQIGTRFALKVLRPGAFPEGFAERFDREAKAAARIRHPGVVQVLDSECCQGRLGLLMELVDGRTLRQRLQEGRPDVAWSCDVVAQLADVLHAAHLAGVVHRDVKPENVLVDDSGRVRVLDFGVSRLLEVEERLTRTGEIVGTPEYLAPEQILDEPGAVGARCDVHAAGVVLYELLTGRSPFAAGNLLQVLRYVEALDPPPPSSLRPGVPPRLDALVCSALAKDQAARPVDAAALAAGLREIAAELGAPGSAGAAPAPPRRWRRRAAVGLGVAAGLAVGLPVGLGLGDTSGDAPVAAPSRRIAASLRSGGAVDAAALWRDAAGIPDDAAPEALYQRGRARQHGGALLLALEDFERAAAAGHEDAAHRREHAWIWVHRLLPELAEVRWLEAKAPAPAWAASAPPGVAALVANDWPAAVAALEAGTSNADNGEPGTDSSDNADPDRAVLLALALYLDAWPERSRAVLRAQPADARYPPIELARALVRPDEAEHRLEALHAAIDRLAPTRYLLGAVLAARRGDVGALRATAELATVAGSASTAGSLYLALRGRLGAGASAPRLLELTGDVAATPGSAVTRLLLAVASADDGALREALQEVPAAPDPALAVFQAWRGAGESEAELYRGWLGRVTGAGDAGRLAGWLRQRRPAPDDDRTELVRLCAVQAWSRTGGDGALAGEIRRRLRRLLAAGADLGELVRQGRPPLLPEAGRQRLAALLVEVAAGALDEVGLERVLPALRAAVAFGLDAGPVFETAPWQALRSRLRRWFPISVGPAGG